MQPDSSAWPRRRPPQPLRRLLVPPLPISSILSRASAAYLGSLGVALLFASDALLPRLIPAFPPGATWVGQLLAGAWLGVALLNWNGRRNVMGGIFGRPQLMLNLVLYVVSALSLVRVPATGVVPWLLTVPMSLLAVAYGALLLRGPFDAPGAGAAP